MGDREKDVCMRVLACYLSSENSREYIFRLTSSRVFLSGSFAFSFATTCKVARSTAEKQEKTLVHRSLSTEMIASYMSDVKTNCLQVILTEECRRLTEKEKKRKRKEKKRSTAKQYARKCERCLLRSDEDFDYVKNISKKSKELERIVNTLFKHIVCHK
jgi:hypothetical protein